MVKYSSLLGAALVAVGALAGSAGMANADHNSGHRRGCGNCGAPTISRYYNTVHPASSVTRYRDLSVYNRVPRLHRIVRITRVQPIIRIHEVTRVHHRTIYYPQYYYANVTQQLVPIQYVTHSVINTYDCDCGR